MMSKMFFFLKVKIRRLLSIRLTDSIKFILNKNNLCVFWCNDSVNKNNFGDVLNPIILEKITGREINNYFKIINFSCKPVIYFIGSVLDNLDITNAVICGAGFQKEDANISKKPANILAVRGPLTRNIFIKNGVECPEVYGDPAILLPKIIQGHDNKQWDIGIIAHYVDKEILNSLKIVTGNGNLSYKIIDIEAPYQEVIDNICSSKYIFSSSLHGLIVAHAYKVPATWISMSENVIGGNFKFNDYALSVNKREMPVYNIDKNLNLEEGIRLSTLYDTEDRREQLFGILTAYFGVKNESKG